MAQQILVVDDAQESGRLVRAPLDQAGFRAVCAFDGASALRTPHLQRPGLLVLDLMLPNRDGLVIVRSLCVAPGPVTARRQRASHR
jgi:two-component system response regulator VicR